MRRPALFVQGMDVSVEEGRFPASLEGLQRRGRIVNVDDYNQFGSRSSSGSSTAATSPPAIHAAMVKPSASRNRGQSPISWSSET